jgi:hypothetical protein
MSPVKLYELSHGASWVLPDGRIIKIQGFHTSWLSSHPQIASGATNTAEFVKKSGWISAVLHEQGYLELITRSVEDQRLRECLWNLLSTNAGILERVVLMILGLEGVLDFGAEAFTSRAAFDETLKNHRLKPE